MKYLFLFLFVLGSFTLTLAEKRDFKKEMYTTLITDAPIKFCQPNLLFRECYQVTEAECKDIITLSMKACYKTFENNISDDLTMKQLIAQGGKIGECAGTLYEVILTKASKRDEECLKNPKWKKSLE